MFCLHVYLCTTYVQTRDHQLPWDWSHRWILFLVEEQQVGITAEPSLQFPVPSFYIVGWLLGPFSPQKGLEFENVLPQLPI